MYICNTCDNMRMRIIPFDNNILNEFNLQFSLFVTEQICLWFEAIDVPIDVVKKILFFSSSLSFMRWTVASLSKINKISKDFCAHNICEIYTYTHFTVSISIQQSHSGLETVCYHVTKFYLNFSVSIYHKEH